MVNRVTAVAIVSLLCSSTLPAQVRQDGARTSGRSAQDARSAVAASAQTGPPVRPAGRAQDAGKPDSGGAQIELKNDHLHQDEQPMDPVLEDLLRQWSAASERFRRLEGRHTRLEFDSVFEVERQSVGRFYYEQPDKGRIEIVPVEITDNLIAARKKEIQDAKAQNRTPGIWVNKAGEPYALEPSQRELWCSDGQRVYELDIEKREAQVAQVPAEMQGANIMDSPLPFLFGMPPDKAKRRFRISFKGPFDPKTGIASLNIEPRLQMDASEWSKASVHLDLKTFLPVAVLLVDSGETKTTVYKFKDIHVNDATIKYWLKGQNPKDWFTPDLRGFAVHNVNAEAAPQLAGRPENEPAKTVLNQPTTESTTAGVANVTGMPFGDAIKQLERQGFIRKEANDPDNTIVLLKGDVATDQSIRGTVQAQEPQAGTPFEPGMKVKLTIWVDETTRKN